MLAFSRIAILNMLAGVAGMFVLGFMAYQFHIMDAGWMDIMATLGAALSAHITYDTFMGGEEVEYVE
jgi:hypothetical protein